MSKFLVLYRAPASAREQMESSTPEQRQAGMELWQVWAGKVGSAIVDLGAPLGDGAIVGDGEAYNDIAGFSILDADSQQTMMASCATTRTFILRAGRSSSMRCCARRGCSRTAPLASSTVERVRSG